MILDPFKKASTAVQITASSRLITAAALCWTVSMMLAAPHVAAQTASTEQYPPEETTETSATSAPAGEAAPAKPWLITPTLAADPKRGANAGGVAAQLFWRADTRRLILLVGAAEINNE